MIFLVYTAQLLSILWIMLHYSQHFQCKKKPASRTQQSPRSPVSSSRSRNLSIHDLKHHGRSVAFVRTFKSPQRYCLRCFQSRDGEQFDLFPISFLLYLVFILMISTLVLIKQFYFDHYDNAYSLYHPLHYSQNPFIIAVHSGAFTLRTTQIRTETYQYSYIMDWILCYCIMALSVVESWFNFNRYFVTKFTSKHFFNPEPTSVVRTFSIYAVTYVLLFMFYIHVWYWVFPLVIGLHTSFNVYCTWHFCAILIERYRFYATVEKGLRSIHEELLRTAYVIRTASMSSALFSSTYIALFCVVYDVDIVIYIPLLWSASNFCFLFNFVRNRAWIQSHFYFVTKCIKTKDVKPELLSMSSASSVKPTGVDVICKATTTPHTNTTQCKTSVNTNDSAARTISNISNVSNTITPVKTPHKTAPSPRLLDIPSPTVATTDESDIAYQKWYSDRKVVTTPTPPDDTHASLPSSPLRISISSEPKPRGSNHSARNLKLFDVFGVDKTPLSEGNDRKDTPLAYDMTPLADHTHKARTPIGGVFMGIWKRASSLIRTNDNELELPPQPSHPRPRTRSSSDPTDCKMNIHIQTEEKEDDRNDAPQNRLVLHISQQSNRSEPGVDGDVYRFKTAEYVASHSMMDLSPQARTPTKSDPKHLVVGTERNAHAQSIPNDMLISVLVSHGFCSRSSFNAAEQLRSYLQDK